MLQWNTDLNHFRAEHNKYVKAAIVGQIYTKSQITRHNLVELTIDIRCRFYFNSQGLNQKFWSILAAFIISIKIFILSTEKLVFFLSLM